ncbi:hypothetical protein Poly30_35070 [Planctomycetes bacterium Poly30]|uniref:Uncharacterized protein n=1 Tax=Saltatorellus ferox TaxID=2528018 RepID=A0A518EV76_9BACT|nr:hypothetical protein Poly30_35070 [Planctomycetes bacterium Poly30]
MTKAPVLILAAAVLGGSLAFLAWKSKRDMLAEDTAGTPDTISLAESGGERAPGQAHPETEDPHLAGIDPIPPKRTGSMGGMAKSWEIIPMNQSGQLLKDASVRAALTGESQQEELTGTGRIRWTDVTSGVWTVTVEAEGLPIWNKTLTLYEEDVARTTARLGDGIHVEGTIVDLDGKPVSAVLAYLLPFGTNHPRREDMVRENGEANGKLIPNNGAIAFKTGAKGQFKAVLPKAGKWRVSVGPPGAARWTQPSGTDLVNGGPETVIVTIPAASTLRLSFGENLEELPSEVMVYAFDPSGGGQAAGRRFDGSGRSGKDSEDESNKPLTEEAFEALPLAERQAIKDRIVRGELQGIEDWQPAAEAPSTPESPMDAGWRAIRSSRPSPMGQVLIKGLPTDQDLRFLFVRGSERIATPGAHRLKEGIETVGVVTLPPAGTAPPQGTDLRAHLRMESIETGAAARKVGVVWE